MTTLVGIDSVGSYSANTAANNLSGTRLILDSFVASATGTATTLYFYATEATGTAPNLKLAIYSSGNALLGNTNAVAYAGSPGWVSAALVSSVEITSGTTYKLGFIGDSGYCGYRTLASPSDASKDDTGTYASLPATITPSVDTGIDNFAMYADGTVGSTAKPSYYYASA